MPMRKSNATPLKEQSSSSHSAWSSNPTRSSWERASGFDLSHEDGKRRPEIANKWLALCQPAAEPLKQVKGDSWEMKLPSYSANTPPIGQPLTSVSKPNSRVRSGPSKALKSPGSVSFSAGGSSSTKNNPRLKPYEIDN
jgi:hypothetical protein